MRMKSERIVQVDKLITINEQFPQSDTGRTLINYREYNYDFNSPLGREGVKI